MLRDSPTSRAVEASVVSRRWFLQAAAAGGGLVLGLHLPPENRQAEAAAGEAFAPNAFVRIGSDGHIVLTMPYVEMGQGTYTSIPMLIAEELEVDLKQVHLEHAPPDEKRYVNPLLGVQATGNSNAVRGAWKPLRQAGAAAVGVAQPEERHDLGGLLLQDGGAVAGEHLPGAHGEGGGAGGGRRAAAALAFSAT